MSEQRILDSSAFINKITVMDKPGAGGACHRYLVTKDQKSLCFVKFQEGPIKEFGVNGCQNEDFLAIVIDRLESFQASNYACKENKMALKKIREALTWLDCRTSKRITRKVEGTYKV